MKHGRIIPPAAWVAALALAVSIPQPGSAAQRTVLAEEFTDIYCFSCAHAGPALDMLLDVYQDSFILVEYELTFEYATPWGDARYAYYNGLYTPTAVFDGTDRVVGAMEDELQQYAIYRTTHLLPERTTPTDVNLTLQVSDLGGQTYRVAAEVALDPGGTGKDLRVFIVQVLDHWPPDRPYLRNTFKQAAPTHDITLLPGQPQLITEDFTFDADSWAAPQDIKIIAWAQAPGDFPAHVYQAAQRLWPLISYPGDDDADGFPDASDNCPHRYNPEQADADGDGVGDICDNCLAMFNPDQVDGDEDRVGDACDNCPTLHAVDQTDTDADSLGDPCDWCPDVPAPGGVDANGYPRGTIDAGCDVDSDDLGLALGCLGGPGSGNPPACDPANFDRADVDTDADVDLADLAVMQLNVTGPLLSPPIYVGAASCAECHAGNHGSYSTTIHATAFNTLIEGGNENNELCFPCHTVGYGLASGFVSLAATPELANVQCENCHGPGSNHVADPNEPLERPQESELCSLCHVSCHGLCGENHHPQYEQWSTAKHSTALMDLWGDPSAEDACLQCHSTDYRLAPPDEKPGIWMAQFDIECVACHDPHGGPNVGQLRLPPWQLCADCHTLGGALPGVTPLQPQAETLHSTGGFAIDGTPLEGPYTMHWWGIADECATCHVHMEPSPGPGMPANSGHTFLANMRACLPCHSEDAATLLVAMMAEEVETRLAEIARRLDPNDPVYVDPAALPPDQLEPYLRATFDYELVREDGSRGSHAPGYARALLSQAESFFGIPPWQMRRWPQPYELWPEQAEEQP